MTRRGDTMKGWARRIKPDGVTLWFAGKVPIPVGTRKPWASSSWPTLLVQLTSSLTPFRYSAIWMTSSSCQCSSGSRSSFCRQPCWTSASARPMNECRSKVKSLAAPWASRLSSPSGLSLAWEFGWYWQADRQLWAQSGLPRLPKPGDPTARAE